MGGPFFASASRCRQFFGGFARLMTASGSLLLLSDFCFYLLLRLEQDTICADVDRGVLRAFAEAVIVNPRGLAHGWQEIRARGGCDAIGECCAMLQENVSWLGRIRQRRQKSEFKFVG